MATTKRKTTTTRKPAAPKERKPAHTKEELLPKIGLVLDAVDAEMAKPDRGAVEWNSDYYGPLKKLCGQINVLMGQLEDVVNPRHLYSAPEDADTAVLEAFGTKGTPTSWARPAMFLMWVGPVPALCTWGGFARAQAAFQAIDPTKPWLMKESSRSTYPSTIPARAESVAWMFRKSLNALVEVKGFAFVPLSAAGLADVDAAAEIVGREWVAAQLKAGPVDAIEIAPKLTEIQQRLF